MAVDPIKSLEQHLNRLDVEAKKLHRLEVRLKSAQRKNVAAHYEAQRELKKLKGRKP